MGLLECPWDDLAKGLALGEGDFVKKVCHQAGRRAASWNRKWVAGVTQKEVKDALMELLKDESDRKLRMWARARLGGERWVDVAKDEGYTDGSGVLVAVKRLEAGMKDNPALTAKMNKIRKDLSSVVG